MRKWRTTCSLILLAAFPCFGQNVKPWRGTLAAPQNGLVGCWLLNEGAGTIVNDLSGNGNTGTITGATWTEGRFGKCLDFGGVSGAKVDVGAAFNFTSEPFSVSFWVYKTAATRLEILLGNGTYKSNGWYVYWDSSNNRIFFRSNQASVHQDTSSLACTTGRWYHLAFVRNGASVQPYVNGLLSMYGSPGSHVDPVSTTTTCKLGAYSAVNYELTGLMDSVRIYNRALSAAEIRALYRDSFAGFRRESPRLYASGAPPGAKPAPYYYRMSRAELVAPLAVVVVVGAFLGQRRKSCRN